LLLVETIEGLFAPPVTKRSRLAQDPRVRRHARSLGSGDSRSYSSKEMDQGMNSRVVVADSDRVTSRVMSLVLTDAGYDAVTLPVNESSGAEITSKQTDLTIIDVDFNGSGGFEFCKDLRSDGYLGPVIFTCTRGDVENKLEAFRIGADDFIVKPFDPLEFVARVQSVIRRSRLADQNCQGALVQVDDAELHVGKLTYKSETVSPTVLTPTEMKILECLMRNHGITISRATLIERVWGYDFLGDTNRIDVYIRRIRRKIEADPAFPQYLHTARGLGYVFQVRRPEPQSTNGTEHSGKVSAR
jgi:two-component system, OmpR family, response regulator RegX3